MSDQIRVLVVELGHRLARELADAMSTDGAVSVVGSVPDAAAAVDALSRGIADLVVVDLDRPDGSGHEAIAAITSHGAGGRGRVLAASDHGGVDAAADAVSAGACGVLPVVRDRSIADVLRRALAGELVLPADDLSRLVDRMTIAGDQRGADLVGALTVREREVLRTLAAGAFTIDVAEAFGISPLTVQSHVKSILAKLEVHSKVEAVRLAWKHGLVTTSPPVSSTR